MPHPDSDSNASFIRRAGPPVNGRRTVLVSGGSSGLGRELVRHFSSNYNVVFGYHTSVDSAEELFGEVSEAGNWTLPVRLDVTDARQVEQLRDTVVDACGALDVLVHTTGHFSMMTIHNVDVETWKNELDTTVSAAFYLWRAFSALLTTSDRGRVIFMGDSAAEHMRAKSQSTGYYIGKHGLVILARTIAREFQSSKLTCNVISPGVLPNSVDLDEPDMHVNVQFKEIAGVIEFLMSPDADSVSGSNMIASRGWNV